MSIEALRAERLAKLARLKKAGIDPYPARSNRSHSVEQFLADHMKFEKEGTSTTLAGRVLSLREHGGSIFADLFDGTGKVQAYLQKDVLGDQAFELFLGVVDQSDIIEISGTAFTTKRGVPSLQVKGWRMLAKSLRPVPDEWFGLKDEDERYRKRYLDILLSKDTADRIRRRSKFWNV